MGTTLSPAGAGPASTYTVPGSIPTTCSSTSPDTTAQLQAWIASVPDNSTLQLSPGACYRVEGVLELNGRNGLVVDGQGATIRSFTDGTGFVSNLSTRHHIFLYGGSNLTFTGVNIVGDNTPGTYSARYAGQAGWWVWGTQGLTLTGDTVTDVRGDFVTLGPDTYRTWQWATNVSITSDQFNGSGRQGIAVTGAAGVTISDNSITNAALSAFDIEPDSGTGHLNGGVPTYGGADTVTIANNIVGHAGTTFLSNYGAPAHISNINVLNNTLSGFPLVVWSKGSSTVHRSNWTIQGNVSDYAFASPRAAMELTYVDGASISGNTAPFYLPQIMTAVRVWGSSAVSVQDNVFVGATTAVAIDLPVWTGTPSTGISVSGNRLTAGGASSAVAQLPQQGARPALQAGPLQGLCRAATGPHRCLVDRRR